MRPNSLSKSFDRRHTMTLGISSYSLQQEMNEGRMSILDVMEWVKLQEAGHIEIVPLNFDLLETPELIEAINEKSQQLDLPLSNYAIGSDLLQTGVALSNEIERIKAHVDIAHKLGLNTMRFDVGFLPPSEATIVRFNELLPNIVSACQEIADYAEKYDITVSIENHGYFIQQSDRLITIITNVNRDNFKLTLDVGNFLCVDESPLYAVKKCLPYASMIHLKDFYYRKTKHPLNQGFFSTINNNQLRGAVTGHGDIPLPTIINMIKDSGYDGNLSIEFEGVEPCLMATDIAFKLMTSYYE